MEFPIILKTKNDFKLFLKKYKLEILNYYHIHKKIDKLKLKLKETQEEQQQLQNKNKELSHLVELKEKKYGEHSMFKGEFDEKQKEIIFKEYFGSQFHIDGCKKMHCMDIRLRHKELDEIYIGIECKDKKKITQHDLDKFKNDKIKNNFNLSVFLSQSAPILSIVKKKHNFKFVNNELYIYSNDLNYIVIVTQIYIVQLLQQDEHKQERFTSDFYIDLITNLYKNWCQIKKTCQKLDQDLVFSLRKIGVELCNGHIFLTPKTKLKNTKNPY